MAAGLATGGVGGVLAATVIGGAGGFASAERDSSNLDGIVERETEIAGRLLMLSRLEGLKKLIFESNNKACFIERERIINKNEEVNGYEL